MLQLLKEQFLEVVKAIAPLIIVVCALQFTLVKAPTALFLQFLIGAVMAVAGLMLFFAGIGVGVIPMGRFIGAELPRKGSVLLIMVMAFLLGFATTVAEPDLLVLSRQAGLISHGTIPASAVLYATAVGVGFFVAVAMLRIVLGFPLVYLLAAGYTGCIILSFFAPPQFIPLAFDAGSATTGALTSPVVIALALGLSSVLAGRSAVSDGFGLLGSASIGPIIAMLLMGILSR